jgi:hypothetical protein
VGVVGVFKIIMALMASTQIKTGIENAAVLPDHFIDPAPTNIVQKSLL